MRYQSEDYFSVIETRTGRKICDCGTENDAMLMVLLDPQNRTYTRNQFMMGQVVDIEIPKALPTTNITATSTQENGCAPRKEQLLNAGVLRLPEDQRIPVNAK